MTKEFGQLTIATQFKCKTCDEFKQLYLSDQYLVNLGIVKTDKEFVKALLTDLEQHIKEAHPERHKAFLKPHYESMCGQKFDTIQDARTHESTCALCQKDLSKLTEDNKRVHDY